MHDTEHDNSGGSAARSGEARPWLTLGALVLGVLALRLAYLRWVCPFDLVEDEAQYWDWSRHLDWSYYTKGPGIAWLIAGAGKVWGATEFAVRVPAAMAGAVAMLAVGRLAQEMSGSRRVGVLAAGALMLAPVMQVTALLGTIDAPYCACWAVAAWCGWRALVRGGTWSWLGLGLALGVGVLFKYTTLLLVPGLALAWWMGRREIRECRLASGPSQVAFTSRERSERSRWWWIMACVVVFAASVSPIVIWNAQHGWAAARHLLGRVGVSESAVPLSQAVAAKAWTWSPLWLPEFVGTQLGMVGPLLVLALAGVWRVMRRGVREHRHARPAGRAGGTCRRYLAACGVPILLFYLAVSVLRAPEGNWPMAAYVTLLPLAGWLAAEGLDVRRVALGRWLATPEPRERMGWLSRRPETLGQVLWHWGVGYGLGAAALMLALSLAPTLPMVSAYVPVARLTQGRTLAAHVQAEREALAPDAPESVMVLATDYGKASHLAFYLPDRPRTLCTSSLFGGRPTNHDFWSDTDLHDAARRGRSAVMVGGTVEQWRSLFERVEDAGPARGLERKGMNLFRGWGYVVPRTGGPSGR